RTDDLTESHEQQTAPSEVLLIISSSPGELGPAFKSMLENATRICGATCGNMFLREGDTFRTVALHGAPPAWAALRERQPVVKPAANVPLGRLTVARRGAPIAEVTKDQAYPHHDPPL